MPNSFGSTTVFITTQFAGIHRWPDAPDEVEYLALPHRHMFGVVVEISVMHNDREIEYHQLKDRVDSHIVSTVQPGLVEDPTQSCEDIAAGILEHLREVYGERLLYRVTVSEDGENGSVVESSTPGASA